MYNVLLQVHSIVRWLFVILLIIAITKALIGWISRNEFKTSDLLINKFLFIVTHIQLLLGILLYIFSPTIDFAFSNFSVVMKSSYLRFWTIEHPLSMLISIILISIAYLKVKNSKTIVNRNRTLAICYIIAIILVLAMTPWPFKAEVGRPWI